jgi:hypothetical protein
LATEDIPGLRHTPTAESRTSMDYLVSRSQRTSGLQLAHSFLRDYSNRTPPLAQLIQGGRGGEVRLKLYLTACLVTAASPYAYTHATASRSWAEALNLDDPGGKGARRVSTAFGWLHENRFLDVDKKKGRTPTFRLLSTTLDGSPYERPKTHYVTVPLGIWKRHWISALSAAELGVFLAILDGPGDDAPGGRPRYLTEGQKNGYGLSEDSWTRATWQLQRLNLIEVDRQVVGGVMRHSRMRNIYRFPDPQFDSEPNWPVIPERTARGLPPR